MEKFAKLYNNEFEKFYVVRISRRFSSSKRDFRPPKFSHSLIERASIWRSLEWKWRKTDSFLTIPPSPSWVLSSISISFFFFFSFPFPPSWMCSPRLPACNALYIKPLVCLIALNPTFYNYSFIHISFARSF